MDYYLGNGKELLNNSIQTLLSIVRRGQQGGSDAGLRIVDVADDLRGLDKAINRHDPHYRYEFRLSKHCPPLPPEPRLVAVQQEYDGETCITYWIFALFDEASIERPPPSIKLEFAVEPGSELEQQLIDMTTYGTPLQAVPASFSADLPGGLGGSFKEGLVTIGPAHTSDALRYSIRLLIADPKGTHLVMVRCDMNPVTRGMTGQGLRASGQETSGVFSFEMRVNNETERATVTVSPQDLTGRAPEDILGGLRWLSAYRSPNTLQIGPTRGPVADQALPISTESTFDVEPLVAVAEILAAIQEHTQDQLKMPSELTHEQYGALCDANRLLRGEVIERSWTSWVFRMQTEGHYELTRWPYFSLMAVTPLTITLDGNVHVLGQYAQIVESARLDPDFMLQPDGGDIRVRLLPGPVETLRLQLSDLPMDTATGLGRLSVTPWSQKAPPKYPGT